METQRMVTIKVSPRHRNRACGQRRLNMRVPDPLGYMLQAADQHGHRIDRVLLLAWRSCCTQRFHEQRVRETAGLPPRNQTRSGKPQSSANTAKQFGDVFDYECNFFSSVACLGCVVHGAVD
jgi:hypothetical protein